MKSIQSSLLRKCYGGQAPNPTNPNSDSEGVLYVCNHFHGGGLSGDKPRFRMKKVKLMKPIQSSINPKNPNTDSEGILSV